jgi:hypothetical protein
MLQPDAASDGAFCQTGDMNKDREPTLPQPYLRNLQDFPDFPS